MDPRPTLQEGDMKYEITPQLVSDLFDEFPVLKTAFDENVPSKVIKQARFYTVSILMRCSLKRVTSGNVISTQSYTICIVPPSDLPSRNTSILRTRYSISIWRSLTTALNLASRWMRMSKCSLI